VISLAEADEDEVLKHWQGLGYYSRARNLHAAAKQIKTQHNGIFPTKYEDVLALRGVGEYTAAAICSFSYNLPYAVLDGNVFRVLARIFGIETPINTPKAKKEFTALAQLLLDANNPSEHNQAIMEFGALQCVPVSPDCSTCPFVEQCVAFSDGIVQKLPVKLKKNSVKERFFNYFFVQQDEFVFLKKREAKDIWQNLYEFPLIETTEKIEIADLITKKEFREMVGDAKIELSGQPFTVKHVLSHRIIHAAFYSIEIPKNIDLIGGFLKIPVSDLHNYPVSRLIEMFIETRNI
jgi:A/G-specific adenine glycosylase